MRSGVQKHDVRHFCILTACNAGSADVDMIILVTVMHYQIK
jgi:hypothetical protein